MAVYLSLDGANLGNGPSAPPTAGDYNVVRRLQSATGQLDDGQWAALSEHEPVFDFDDAADEAHDADDVEFEVAPPAEGQPTEAQPVRARSTRAAAVNAGRLLADVIAADAAEENDAALIAEFTAAAV